MPRININEKDRTSPGTPGGYSNNTVLIAGFSTRETADVIEAMEKNKSLGYVLPDDNGIFEFESSDDFVKTLGLVAPEVIQTSDDGVNNKYTNKIPPHYGNQMAYELLKMGYPIIYINLGRTYTIGTDDTPAPLTELEVAGKMKTLGLDSFEDTWGIFKDKASYDFRFISHGLLTSGEIAKSDDLINYEKRVAKLESFMASAEENLVRFNGLNELQRAFTETEQEEYNNFFQKVPVLDENNEPMYEKKPDSDEYVLDKNGQKIPVLRTQTPEEVIDGLKQDCADRVVELEADLFDKAGKPTEAAKLIGYTKKYFAAGNTYLAVTGIITAEQAALDKVYKAEGIDAFTKADFLSANAAIAKLAHYKAVVDAYGNEDEMDPTSGRGDCTALIEVDESTYNIPVDGKRPENQIVDAINEIATSGINVDNGKYCACTVPSVVYKMVDDDRFGGNKKFPGAFHYLACFKNSIGLGFAEWYAAAGYTRGVSSYAIDHTTVKLGEIAIQALEPRYIKDQSKEPKFAANVIANFRGNYYLWGNRTCHPLSEYAGGGDLVASHFLNIRQLCTTIKKQLYVSCRRFTFDPNSDVLWINFKNSILPMLERMKADQGVRDFKIEKVYTDKKATLKAKIRIVPIEAVEDFLLEVSLEDSLGETAVTITE